MDQILSCRGSGDLRDRIRQLQEILRLRHEIRGEKIVNLGKRAPQAKKLLDYLFTQPIVTAAEVASVLGLSMC